MLSNLCPWGWLPTCWVRIQTSTALWCRVCGIVFCCRLAVSRWMGSMWKWCLFIKLLGSFCTISYLSQLKETMVCGIYMNLIIDSKWYKLVLQHNNLTEQLAVLLSQLHMMYPRSSRMLPKYLLLNILLFGRLWLLVMSLVMSSIMRPCSHTWNLSQWVEA